MSGDRQDLDLAKGRVSIAEAWRRLELPGDCRPGKPMRSPLRADKRAGSFTVDRDGRLWWDFATSEGGDVVSFIRVATGKTAGESIRLLLEWAGLAPAVNGRPAPVVRPAATRPSVVVTDWKPRARPSLPEDATDGSQADWESLTALRGISRWAVQQAVDAGMLRFGTWRQHRAWFVTDRTEVNAQARRVDGVPWWSGAKSLTLPRSRAKWPLGIRGAGRRMLWVEGGPDLVAAFDLIRLLPDLFEGYRPVGMLGAGLSVHAAALPLVAGAQVALLTDHDAAGETAAKRWAVQLRAVGARLCWDGPAALASAAVKDVNEWVKALWKEII